MTARTTFVLLACAALAACAAPRARFHSSPDPALAALPFSEAVEACGLVFLAGQVGTVPGELRLVPGGIGPETRQTIENIKAILARRGLTLDDVVKVTVFLADISEWPAMNEVYREHFDAPYPARSAAGASGLALGARVEIEVIAQARR